MNTQYFKVNVQTDPPRRFYMIGIKPTHTAIVDMLPDDLKDVGYNVHEITEMLFYAGIAYERSLRNAR